MWCRWLQVVVLGSGWRDLRSAQAWRRKGAQEWCLQGGALQGGARRLLGDRTGSRMGSFAPEFHNPLELLLFYLDSEGDLVDARFRSRTISVRYDRKEN